MQVKFKYIGNNTPPKQQTEGAAGLDLFNNEDAIVIPVGKSKVISTGFYVEIPKGYVGIVAARSSLGFKYDCTLSNSIGVIDEDYRGEVKVKIINHSKENKVIDKYERVAQLLLIPYLRPEYIMVDELTETERGANGFGSTGQK